jgi:hypothetical protein
MMGWKSFPRLRVILKPSFSILEDGEVVLPHQGDEVFDISLSPRLLVASVLLFRKKAGGE